MAGQRRWDDNDEGQRREDNDEEEGVAKEADDRNDQGDDDGERERGRGGPATMSTHQRTQPHAPPHMREGGHLN